MLSALETTSATRKAIVTSKVPLFAIVVIVVVVAILASAVQ